jgi:hypothetical protein
MKKIISKVIFATVVALGLISCEKTGGNFRHIVGEWFYQEADVEVYIDFNLDGTFEMYQKLGESEGANGPRYRLYTGTFEYDGITLKGKYADKSNWERSYTVSVEGDNLKMNFTEGEKAYSYVYVKKTIPFYVKKYCTEPLKSAFDEVVPFL